MQYRELIQKVAQNSGVSKKVAKSVIETFREVVKEEVVLKKGTVSIPKFGKFYAIPERKMKVTIGPKKGQMTKVPPLVRFKNSRILRGK